MEYIEGPDLGELLKPPHPPIFTIKETIKVADHLSNALAHCHRANVKHGDIKSNNVKFNQHTGNYILLDFGLSIMSDEQRRTSISVSSSTPGSARASRTPRKGRSRSRPRSLPWPKPKDRACSTVKASSFSAGGSGFRGEFGMRHARPCDLWSPVLIHRSHSTSIESPLVDLPEEQEHP